MGGVSCLVGGQRQVCLRSVARRDPTEPSTRLDCTQALRIPEVSQSLRTSLTSNNNYRLTTHYSHPGPYGAALQAADCRPADPVVDHGRARATHWLLPAAALLSATVNSLRKHCRCHRQVSGAVTVRVRVSLSQSQSQSVRVRLIESDNLIEIARSDCSESRSLGSRSRV